MDYLFAVLVIGLQLVTQICSETIGTGSDITTEFDDITEIACNSSLQPANIIDPGYIYPPRYNNGTYLADQDCRWLLRAPQGSIVSLEFTFVEVVETFRCHFANITVYDGSSVHSDKMLRLCGHDESPVLYASQMQTLIVFQSGRVVEGRGFEAIFGTEDIYESGCVSRDFDSEGWENGGLYSPNWPLPYHPSANCEWRITSVQPVRLEFLDFDLKEADSDGVCGADRLIVSDLNSDGHEDVLGQYCGQYLPSNLGSTDTGLLVMFQTGNNNTRGVSYTGFRLRFRVTNTTERACTGNGLMELDWAPGLLTSPTTDQSLCTWRLTAPITRLIRLLASSFDLPQCEQCGCAGLEIYDGPTHNSPLIGRFCGSGWAEPLAIGSNQVFLQYDSYQLYEHKGFEVLYEYEDISVEACGSNRPVKLTHDDGVITSLNYNQGTYPNNANCQWLVTTSFGYSVTLEFNTFEIEHCESCKCDYVRVHNGADPSASHTHVGTYCGKYPPQPITSTVPAIFITFVTDSSNRCSGFKINYRFTYLADKACGAAQPLGMSHEPGEILSEGYELGSYYKSNSDCFWRVTADTHKTIDLHLQEFDVEGGDHCEFDYFIIYDGMDDKGPVIARLCDKVDPSVYKSEGNQMFLIFHSNHVIEKKGFYFEYNFRDSSGGSGIGFLPAVLVTIVVLGVMVMIGAYCRVSSGFKKFKAWLRRVTGRNTTNEEEMQPPRNSRSTGVTETDHNNTDFVPPPVRDVVCPPSDVDNMHYYAIADYAPPTYEEAVAETSLNTASTLPSGERAITVHTQGDTSTQLTEDRGSTLVDCSNITGSIPYNTSTQSGTSSTSVSTLQSIPVPSHQSSRARNTDNTRRLSQVSSARPLTYPGTSSTSNRPSTSLQDPPNNGANPRDIRTNHSAMGNPDMGVSLLRQTGLYRCERVREEVNEGRDSEGRSQRKPSTHNATPPPPHIQRSRSVDGLLGNYTTANSYSNARSSSTNQLGPSSGVSDLYNPVYDILQENSRDSRDRVKDKGPQGQTSCVEVTSHKKGRKSCEEVEKGDKEGGIENIGYVCESSLDNSHQGLDVNSSIVLHRLDSRDTAV